MCLPIPCIHPALPCTTQPLQSKARTIAVVSLTRKQLALVILGWAFFGWLNGTRIHRSAIVNLDRVREMRPLFRGELVVVLHDGQQLRMSRGRREDLESRFRQR